MASIEVQTHVFSVNEEMLVCREMHIEMVRGSLFTTLQLSVGRDVQRTTRPHVGLTSFSNAVWQSFSFRSRHAQNVEAATSLIEWRGVRAGRQPKHPKLREIREI